MADIVSPRIRSRMMSGIRSKDTKPEMIVRRALISVGFRFRLHRKDLPGAPDIVLPSRKIAIFVHGCFWHQHPKCQMAKFPSSNSHFWRSKLTENRLRDRRAVKSLCAAGWRVLTIWECATRSPAIERKIGVRVRQWVEGNKSVSELREPVSFVAPSLSTSPCVNERRGEVKS